jgi:hypothetical protein
MRIGQIKYFCNCLLGSKDHVTVTSEDEDCLYCGFAAVKREVKDKDIRDAEKHKKELHDKKFEALEIYIKDRRHNEKVN